MADNVAITAGSGTTIAADDVGAGVLVQRVKTTWGPDGTANDADVATGKPLPVQLRSDVGTAVVVVEDAAAAADPVGPALMAVRRDTLSITEVSADGDNIALKATNKGQLHVYDGSTNVNGQAAAANSAPVVAANQGHVGTMTFTPAASSHVANSCNGAATSCTSMGFASSSVIITSASLEIDGATAEATAWRLYLYNVTPPSATADAGAWDLPSGDRASYLGYIDLGTAVDLGSTQWVETNGFNKQVRLGATPSIFAYLVNLTTLTPAAVAHIVTLHTVEV